MAGWPTTLLVLLIGVAGWYYLFYSRAAHHLGTIESTPVNLRRIRLRRMNGAAMILLSALLYIGTRAIDYHEHPLAFVGVWLAVFVLLLIAVVLALADIRLTQQLRKP